MENQKEDPPKPPFNWERYLMEAISRVGVAGTVVLVLLAGFVLWGTESQHQEFINRYILLNTGKWQYIAISALLLSLIVLTMAYRKSRKESEKKVAELKADAERWQKLFIESKQGSIKEKPKK